MSLSLLLPPAAAAALTAGWPTEPAVHTLPETSLLPKIINGRKLADYVTTGCYPADLVNVIDDAALRHPNSYSTATHRLNPHSISHFLAQGCTIQTRKIDLVFPPLAHIVAAIRAETGSDGYVSGFITPGGGQGLNYHWDQTCAIIVQLEGTKTWEMWAPVVNDPYGYHLDSVNFPALPGLIEELTERGPDLTVNLTAGHVLVLPRGWIHNPHSKNLPDRSVHITFVIQERTPQWIAERLTASAVAAGPFRAGIPADQIVGAGLTDQVTLTRKMLVDYLAGIDDEQFAKSLRDLALTQRGFA